MIENKQCVLLHTMQPVETKQHMSSERIYCHNLLRMCMIPRMWVHEVPFLGAKKHRFGGKNDRFLAIFAKIKTAYISFESPFSPENLRFGADYDPQKRKLRNSWLT